MYIVAYKNDIEKNKFLHRKKNTTFEKQERTSFIGAKILADIKLNCRKSNLYM